MKHLLKISTLFLFAFFVNFNSFSQEVNNENITEIAKKNIQKTLQKIPVGYEKNYGFNDRSEFEKVEIGQSLRMYIIDNKNLKTTNTWRVPIIIENKYCAFATVAYINNELQIVDFGATELAKDIQKTINENPKKQFDSFLRVHPIYSDFLINPNAKDEFIALTSAKRVFNSKKSNIYKLEEVINKIKQ